MALIAGVLARGQRGSEVDDNGEAHHPSVGILGTFLSNHKS